MKNKSKYAVVVVAAGLLTVVGCGGDSPANSGGDPCQIVIDHHSDCGVSGAELDEVSDGCEMIDEAIVDDLLAAMADCLVGLSCDDLAEPPEGWAEGESPFDFCFGQASLDTTPPQANQDFVETYCDLYSQCDPEVTDQMCLQYMAAEGFLYYVIDQPYLGQLEACVDPAPECADFSEGGAVDQCMYEVLSQLEIFQEEPA